MPEHGNQCGGYILNELYWDDGSSAGFSYPAPSNRVQVHNRKLPCCRLVVRVYKHTGEEKIPCSCAQCSPLLRFKAARKWLVGLWRGALATWIDNFHTGYNLCALRGRLAIVPRAISVLL